MRRVLRKIGAAQGGVVVAAGAAHVGIAGARGTAQEGVAEALSRSTSGESAAAAGSSCTTAASAKVREASRRGRAPEQGINAGILGDDYGDAGTTGVGTRA